MDIQTKKWFKRSYLSYRVRDAIGTALTRLGIPGFIREGEYEGFGKKIKVSTKGLYTIITVDRVDIDVCRFTGKIVGVGLRYVDHCK